MLVSYSTVILYKRINKVWGFLPKDPTKKLNLPNMLPDLTKPDFHTHPILQI